MTLLGSGQLRTRLLSGEWNPHRSPNDDNRAQEILQISEQKNNKIDNSRTMKLSTKEAQIETDPESTTATPFPKTGYK